MGSFSFSVCFSLFFFFVDDDDDFVGSDDDDDVLAVLVVVVTIVSFSGWLGVICFYCWFFGGGLLLFSPLTTWVQPSSLSGLSPVLALGVSFLFTSVAAAIAACVRCRFCCCCCCGRSGFGCFLRAGF